MTRGSVAVAMLAVVLIGIAAWCLWVIASVSRLRDDVANNVSLMAEAQRLDRSASADGTLDHDALQRSAMTLAHRVANHGDAAVRAGDALREAAASMASAPADPGARVQLTRAADALVAALRVENREVSTRLGARWRSMNMVAVTVLVLSMALLAMTVIAQRRRRRAEHGEAALRTRTAALQHAAARWASGDLAPVPVPAGPDGDFAAVLENLRMALSTQVLELERRNASIAELAADLREQLIAKTEEVKRLAPFVPASAATRIVDKYELGPSLGSGGMGHVFRATRVSDGRPLALKLINDPRDLRLRARFVKEARLLADVRHPNVIRIVDIGIHEQQPFLVTELVEGVNLTAGAGVWPLERSLSVLRATAAGLAAIHAAGIIHRDLKLSNVMVGRVGDAPESTKIVDFGIALLASEVAAAVAADGTLDTRSHRSTDPTTGLPEEPLTAAGRLMGTLRYMAPEVRLGQTLLPAADVFSFGVLAVKLLTAEFPWSTPALLIMRHHVTLPAPSIDTPAPIPDALRELLHACLALEPTDRPRADELGHRLDELLS